MEFYNLNNAVTRKKVGRYMQTKGFVEGYDQYGPNSMWKLNDEEFPNFVPDLRFDLEKTAKLTDVVSASNISARGFLINEKVKNIFESCKLPDHRYYDATINAKGEIHKYYWLHLLCNDLSLIDFPNSSFYLSSFFDNQGYVPVLSVDDYFSKKKEKRELKGDDFLFIFADKIKLLPTDDKFDLIVFPYIFSLRLRYLISSELKEKLEKEKVTGIDIEPQDILLPW